MNGLDGQVGDLMVLPKSQYSHWDSRTMQSLFGDQVLPNSKTFDNMPPGSAVICHSGLVHGRRAKPGGDFKRYFVDVSYCQPGERLCNNNMERKEAERLLAEERNLHRDGKYRHLWDNAVFTDAPEEGDKERAAVAQRAAAFREQVERQTGGAVNVR